MSKKTATQAAPGAADHAPSGGKSALVWKLIILGIVLAVIGGECLVAFVYVTSGASKAAQAESSEAAATANGEESHAEPSAKHEPAEHGDAHGKEAGHGETAANAENASGDREIDLGEFSLTAFRPESNTTLMINFHLFGTLPAGSEQGFGGIFDANKHRIRDQVIMTVRSAELADLTDPGLGLIKRQILEKTNRALGKPLLQGVIFSDMLIVEQ